jgi:polyisoprenoid-binding protein YceI
MKSIVSLGLATVLSLPAAAAFAAPWNLDASHSEIGFKVRHMMVSDARGRFSKATATLDWDGKKLDTAKLSVEIDVASVDTRDEKRDGHLKSEEFFAVEKHPKMSFVSTKVKPAGKGKFSVEGELTIRGVTNTRVGFSAKGKINRKDFGVNWNAALDKGGVVVAEEVFLELDAEFIQAK